MSPAEQRISVSHPTRMSAFRASRTLLNRVPESPHQFHYHEGKTPFWRKFREMFSLNPYVFLM